MIRAIGCQTFTQRFPGKRRTDEDLPRLAPWRCNLTGLSQRHNLYFVACSAEIIVYIPSFPAQDLGQPVLVIPFLPTSSNLRGYLDPRNPHAINNLLVADLGTEEVIATVHDTGDVQVILVRHVLHAIQTRKETQINIRAEEIRPFFQQNVQQSAWGLAIHSEARIIAVSCNTHMVSLFKFAIVDNVDRQQDVTQAFLNGWANIPCIAFCNTGDDPEARWLLTTDITGITRLVDLQSPQSVQEFHFGYAGSSFGYDRNNAGWNVIFLDPRSFKAEPDHHRAFGLPEGASLVADGESARVWDVGKTVKYVADTSESFIPHQGTTTAEAVRSPQASMMDESDIDIDIYEELSVLEYEESLQSGDDDYDHEMSEEDADSDESYSKTIFDDHKLSNKIPHFPTDAIATGMRCPILCAGVYNIYMLQPHTTEKTPFVGLMHPLRQQLQARYDMLDVYDRLNMKAYIPSLGVIILASQKGRAIVLALTKLARSTQLPPNMRISAETVYTTRIAAILPFASQEQQNLRPCAPLHGIAASPLQGSEHLHESQKRWRLLLMYQDHTVLSYEISRPEPVADMVV